MSFITLVNSVSASLKYQLPVSVVAAFVQYFIENSEVEIGGVRKKHRVRVELR